MSIAGRGAALTVRHACAHADLHPDWITARPSKRRQDCEPLHDLTQLVGAAHPTAARASD